MNQPEHENCKFCGAKLSSRNENLSPGLCRTLVNFYKRANARALHLQKDLDFTKTEFNNFQKLKYFRLVEQEENRSGYWRLTPRGLDFVRCRIPVERQAEVFRNRVKSVSAEKIYITEAMEITEPYWMTKADYAQSRLKHAEQARLF